MSHIRTVVFFIFFVFSILSFQNCASNFSAILSSDTPGDNEPQGNGDQAENENILFNGDFTKSKIHYPMVMSFKAFKGLGNNIYDKDGNYRQPYVNAVNESRDIFWIHNANDEQTTDLAMKINGKSPYNNDFWGSRARSKVITHQDAYGAVSKFDYINVWPGHILYSPGTNFLSLDRKSNDSKDPDYNLFILKVSDPAKVATKQSLIDSHNNETFDSFIITIYDPTNWNHSEFVKVITLNADGTFTVERQTWRARFIGDEKSENLVFQSGQAIVATPIRYWDSQLQLNLSLDCPFVFGSTKPDTGVDDPYPHNGEVAGQWYARKIATRVKSTGANGVEFDVARWTWGKVTGNRLSMDANNDLKADYGYFNGINSFGLGSRIFFESLRKLMGDKKIIQADSTRASSGMRDYRYLNGVQMEAFPNAGDWNRFSDAFLHLRNWTDKAGVNELGKRTFVPVSYPFAKTVTEAFNVCNAENQDGVIAKPIQLPAGCENYTSDTYKGLNFHFRVALAAATLTLNPSPFMAIANEKFDPDDVDAIDKYVSGVFHWDEYQKGADQQTQWLGSPVGPLQRDLSDITDKAGADLFTGSSWKWVNDTNYTKSDVAGQPPGVYSTVVLSVPSTDSVLPNDTWSGVRLETNKKVNLLPGQDYTLEFEASGDDIWNYRGFKIDGLPRMITLNVPAKSNDVKPISILIGSSPTTYKISFNAIDCVLSPESGFCNLNQKVINDSINLSFGISEQIGQTTIKNMKLYQGSAERWYREFENGIVLLNMTNSNWSVDLNKLTVSKGIKLRRLNGTIDPLVNSGSEFNGIVPARDALFLSKY